MKYRFPAGVLVTSRDKCLWFPWWCEHIDKEVTRAWAADALRQYRNWRRAP